MSRYERTGWRLIPTTAVVASLSPTIQSYQKERADGHLTVMVGEEDGRWHLSISHRTDDLSPGRYPTWDEISEARYEFCPKGATMALLLPPREEYVNAHATTFHLWQIPGEDA